MAAGMNCGNTLSPATREMTLEETIKFLEPQEEVRNSEGKIIVSEKGPALCQSLEDFNKNKTSLEVACEMMGNQCSYEMKEAIQKMTTTISTLQTKVLQKDGIVMNKISRIPKYGDRGEDVSTLQKQLKQKGKNPGSIDGVFGKKVLAAVQLFQKENGLPGSGEIGPVTLQLLGLELQAEAPVTQRPDGITREIIAATILKKIDADIRNKLRETNGKNRSPRIDEMNLRAGAYLGAPYCASAAWCAYDDACKELGLKNPIPKTASSQDFRRSSFVPAKYLRPAGALGKKGDVGTLQVPTDQEHGHHTTLSKDQVAQPYFDTAEYNTDGSGSRDGDGAYYMTRSTIDGSIKNAFKNFVSFADIPQWILDFNQA